MLPVGEFNPFTSNCYTSIGLVSTSFVFFASSSLTLLYAFY